jgi:hypothetical protein
LTQATARMGWLRYSIKFTRSHSVYTFIALKSAGYILPIAKANVGLAFISMRWKIPSIAKLIA